MYYPEEVIEEVRTRNDIVDIVSQYVNLKKKGANYFGLCPFHNEKSPSFSVSPGKQMYYCFGCGAGGNVITFVMEYENYTFVEAVKMLADRAGIALPEVEYSKEARAQADLKNTLLEINRLAANFFYYQLKQPSGKVGYDYFKEKRRLTDDTIRHFGLGYSSKVPDDLYRYMRSKGYNDDILKETGLFFIDERGARDKFWNRVMFPILDVNNRVIGFGGRVMGDGEPKYLNSPETKIFDKSRNLYGLNFARSTKKPQLLLCEGYMDVIALHQAGFDNAVASLGTALTSGHANLLKRYTKNVYLTYDSDGAGVKAALRAIPILKEVGITTKVINMKPYKDPDEFIKALGAEEYQKRIDTAENSFMFEIRILEQQYDMHDPESKTKFYNAVAEKLCTFGEKLERDNYIAAVADKYMIGIEDLRRLVNQYGAKIGMAAGGAPPVRERSELRREQGSEKKKENGMIQSQKLLLTWLIEHTGLFPKIEKYISPEDFTEEIYHKAAEILYEQYRNTGTVNPAKIVSMFQNEEEQREIAGLFHATIRGVETEGDKENGGYSKETFEKALKETIVRVKQNSIEYHLKNMAPTDMAALQRSVADKKALEELEKVHISID